MFINFKELGYNGGGSGSGATYTAGEYIDITNNVISVSGITPEDYLTSADTENFLTSADTQNFLTSADTADFVTSGDVETQITEKNYVTSGDVKTQVEAYEYMTSAQTESAITSAVIDVEAHITDVERVTASALTELHTGLMEVSANTPDMTNYYTSAQTNTAIDNAIASESARCETAYTKTGDLTAYTPTTGFSTINGSAITNGGNLVISGGSSYTLPAATDSTLGGIIKGSFLTIESNGTLSVDANDLRYNSGYFDDLSATQLHQRDNDGTNEVYDEFEITSDDKRAILGSFYPMSGIVTFNTSDVESNLSDGDECFGLSYSVGGGDHLHLYYHNDGEGNIYYDFDDDDATEVDLTTDGTSAYTLTRGYDPNDTGTIPFAYTYYVTVTVDNGDVTMVFTLSIPERGGYQGIQMWGTYTNLETDEPVFYVNTPQGGIQMLAHTEGKSVTDEYDNEYEVKRWVKYVNEDNIKDFGLVQSNSISNMWKGTQAEYDTLTQSGATADPNTFYIILPTV